MCLKFNIWQILLHIGFAQENHMPIETILMCQANDLNIKF
jgi:hypothetical protein